MEKRSSRDRTRPEQSQPERSPPQELSYIIPFLPSVPIVPLLQVSEREYGIYEHFINYPWVQPIYHYRDLDELLRSLQKHIIDPAEKKVRELAIKKAMSLPHPLGKEGQPEYAPHFHPYYLAATFRTHDEVQEPYTKAQQMIGRDEELKLSAYRFERRPHDLKQPPLPRPWCVVVLGDRPPEPIQLQLQAVLSAGELTQLPLETIVTLTKRRESETKKGSWVQGLHGAGVCIPEVAITLRRKNKKNKRQQPKRSRHGKRG